ncbi:unnamed protein product [Camellia sinensis]
MPQMTLIHASSSSSSSWLSSCLDTVIYASLIWLIFRIAKLLLWSSHNDASDSKLRVPPGNRGLPFIGETLQLMKAVKSSNGVHDFVRVRRLRYGICFKTNVLGQTHVFLSSTESAKAILNNDSGRFPKTLIKSMAKIMGQESVFSAPKQHKLIRNHLAYFFSTSSVLLFIKQFDKLVLDALGSWEHKGTVIIHDEVVKIILKTMLKNMMSLEREDEVEMMQKDIATVWKALPALPIMLPWTRYYKGFQARQRIMARVEKIFSERRSGSGAHHEDFLQHLLTETPSLTDAQIKDNILTMIIAGQDTTASAIAWMVKFLGENQEIINTLKAEQLSLVENFLPESFQTLDNLNDMPYASKVVKESLRMASIVQWYPRLVVQDCEIHGYTIKKGWKVNVDAKSIHYDPAVYKDPNKFIPSRFDAESKPYSFIPFGQGERICMGMYMARAMMLVFLHRLVVTYKWKVIDSDSSILKGAPFMTLKTGCPIHVTPIREGAKSNK